MPSNATPESESSPLEELDPNGDIVMIVNNGSLSTKRQFLVSSKILSLASPVFAKLFSPHFLEGAQMAIHARPEIQLHDDDPTAMGLIFGILHHHTPEDQDSMDADRLFDIAVHCDKYDCVQAARTWVTLCVMAIESKQSDLGAEDIGLLLTVAHLMRSSDCFSRFSRKAQMAMGPLFTSEWDKHSALSMLPSATKRELTEAVNDLLRRICSEVQLALNRLGGIESCYSIEAKFCVSCGRTLPIQAKKCHPCRNSDLPLQYCTTQTRVATLFAALDFFQMWTSVLVFQEYSASGISKHIAMTCQNARWKHSCDAGSKCPLVVQLDQLLQRVRTILDEVKGLSNRFS